MITLDRVEVECGLVWFGLVWWRFTVFEVDGLVSYITVISPFLFQIGLFVYWCRCYFVVSVLPSLTSSTAHFSLFFHFHFCHFFFSFTSFLFFFTFLLSLWSQVCVRCIKCIYISLGLFFLLLFFTSFLYLLFFFPSLSLSLSLLLALYASFVIWTIYTRMNKTKLKVDRSTHVLL